MITIKRLNIFIDESGDFGFVDGSSDLYAVSFTLHESSDSIQTELKYLNEKLTTLNYEGMIHLAYLIAKRGDYSHFDFERRKSIFWAIFYFSSRVKAQIFFEKLETEADKAAKKLQIEALQLSISRREKLLSNENYINKAPEKIVALDRKKLEEEKQKLEELLK